MNSEFSQFVSESFIGPVVFTAMCCILYVVLGYLLYYLIFNRVPAAIVNLVVFGGLVYIIFFISERFEKVRTLLSGFSSQQLIVAFFIYIVVLGVSVGLIDSTTKSKRKKRTTSSASGKSKTTKKVTASTPRKESKSDQEILNSSFDQLSGAEFERLLAIYFRDQGYQVEEVGVGGSDGGVDLIITDKRGEKTAIQAKCYADHNKIGVSVVRELVGAKRNHDCILSLLITTSDLTGPAKKEAEQFKVEYWHGGLLDYKLRTWGKWQPTVKKRKVKVSAESLVRAEIETAKLQTTATKDSCSCGANMVLRKSKEGKQFYGCSTFPKCRVTRSI